VKGARKILKTEIFLSAAENQDVFLATQFSQGAQFPFRASFGLLLRHEPSRASLRTFAGGSLAAVAGPRRNYVHRFAAVLK
jgi:hypothetical protein